MRSRAQEALYKLLGKHPVVDEIVALREMNELYKRCGDESRHMHHVGSPEAGLGIEGWGASASKKRREEG